LFDEPFAKYFFGDDRSATLFRTYVKPLNNLFAFTSAGVKPLLDGMKWQDCYKSNATVTFQHCDTYHYLGKNIVPDKDFGTKSKSINNYAETYALDEGGQLERRLAVGDKTFILKNVKNEEDRKLLKKIIEDIQEQLLTTNSFVRCFQNFRKECDNDSDLLKNQPGDRLEIEKESSEMDTEEQDQKQNENDIQEKKKIQVVPSVFKL